MSGVREAKVSSNIKNFLIKSYKFESEDNPRLVKVAAVQTQASSSENPFENAKKIIEIAAEEGVNILALPELFSLLYPFYTPNSINWKKFVEDYDGQTTEFFKKLAKIHKMIIITSILERDEEKIYNSCFVISNYGEIIGKYRKHHIPPIEAPYLSSGDFDPPIFETDFGRIGILICYERHFPLRWLFLAQKGAEIIFNPSSEDSLSLSERLWPIEGLNAAAFNGIFTVSINRVGMEDFRGEKFNYFGNSYISSPNGYSTPVFGDKQGILIAECDLNLIKSVKENVSFHKNQKLEKYLQILVEVSRNK